MARTTAAEVEEIIEVDDTISLTAFITTANELVTECCTDSDYSDARLELIERWLSAHFYAIRDPRSEMEKAGSVSEKKKFELGLILNVTRYGQMAMTLDTAGNLAALSKRIEAGKPRTIGVTWLGTDYDEETEE